MHPYLVPHGAGRTVAHPSFSRLQLPEYAVIVEMWPNEQAELDNGLLLPLSEIKLIDTSERWLPIPDYASYLISSHGKVISLSYKRTSRQRLMRVQKPATYPFVYVANEYGKKQAGINRLVAQAFLPTPEARLTMVIPLDGNHLNVHADNLRWVDPHEKEDASIVGYLHCCGTRHPLSKLTPEKIMLIQQQVAAGHSHQSIADTLKVSRPAVSVIAAGKAWRSAQQLPSIEDRTTV